MNVTRLDRSNTYEFKFKGKNIVLKPVKPKSSVGNNKEGAVTEKSKIPCYLVTRSHFSLKSPIDRSTPRSRNYLVLLSFFLGISLIVTVEPSASFCMCCMIITPTNDI